MSAKSKSTSVSNLFSKIPKCTTLIFYTPCVYFLKENILRYIVIVAISILFYSGNLFRIIYQLLKRIWLLNIFKHAKSLIENFVHNLQIERKILKYLVCNLFTIFITGYINVINPLIDFICKCKRIDMWNYDLLDNFPIERNRLHFYWEKYPFSDAENPHDSLCRVHVTIPQIYLYISQLVVVTLWSRLFVFSVLCILFIPVEMTIRPIAKKEIYLWFWEIYKEHADSFCFHLLRWKHRV